MNQRRFSTIPSLIADLLDRHEKRPAAKNLIARIDNDGFDSITLRDAFDDELASLEHEGGLELIRSGPKLERVVTGARLRDPKILYRWAGRQPAGEFAAEVLSGLRGQYGTHAGAARLIDEAAAAWSRGVTFMGIASGDVRTLGHIIKLAEAAHCRRVEAPEGEVDFRTFSRLSAGDSKALERNLRQVASAIGRIFGSSDDEVGLEPDELLSSLGIRRLPQPLLIHGPITLDGRPFPDLPYVGIPIECVERLNLLAKPKYLMTIENFTSFVRYVRSVAESDSAVVIYSGGFPSRPALAAIRRLASQARVPTYHWGDMDAGGVRIFRHLERHLAEEEVRLRPHMMDIDLLRRVGVPVNGASRVVGNVAGSAVEDLGRLIKETGLVHEQEEFSPRAPS